MPGSEQLFDQFADLSALEAQKAKILAIYNEVKAGIKELNSVGIKISGASSVKDLNGATQQYSVLTSQLAATQAKLAAAEDQLAKARLSSATSTKTLTKEQALANVQTAEANQLAKLQANLMNSVAGSTEHATASIKLLEYQQKILNTSTEAGKKKYTELSSKIQEQKNIIATSSGAYAQLVIRFNAAAAEAKNLAAQYGQLDPRAKAAAQSALALNNQLKSIDASIGNHQRNVGHYEKALEGAKDKLKEFGNVILSFVGITAGIQFLESSVDAFLELDKAERILQNTTKNLGIPELFARIGEQTEKLETRFKFLKGEDIASSFNKLLVYGKLSEAQINELLPVIVNFATATGKDLPEATGILLKSLEGNARGLKEFGINIKDGKNESERFKIIMDELAPRVEGVGDAFGKSAAGGIASAREEFRKIKEEVGEKLTPVLSGLLTAFSHIITGLEFIAEKTKEVTLDIFDFFDGIRGSTDKFIRDQEKQHKIIERAATLLREDLQDKGIVEQKDQIVELNKQLYQMTKLLALAKANKAGTFTTDDVERYQKGVNVIQKALDQVFKFGAEGKGPLANFGDGTGEAKKKIEDFSKDIKKIQEDILKAQFELSKQRIQDQQDADQQIINDEKSTFVERLRAAQDFYAKSQEMSDLSRAYELQALHDEIQQEKDAVNEKLKDLGGDATKTQRQQLAQELLELDRKEKAEAATINAKFNSENVKNNTDREKQITNIVKQESDRRKKLREDEQKNADEHQKSVHELNLEQIQHDYDAAEQLLDERFARQEISEKEYNAEKLRLSANLNKSLLEEDIAFTAHLIEQQKARFKADEDELQHKIDLARVAAALETDPQIKRAKLAGADEAESQLAQQKVKDNDIIAASEQKLADLQLKLTKLVSQFKIDKNKQTTDDTLKTFELIADTAKSTIDLIGGLVSASADRQKNAIQDQIDLLDQQKEKDIEVANASIANAQDREIAISLIEKNAQAKREALERRQRQIDQDRARFEKAAGIANIIINTAVAVTKFLSKGDIPEAIIAAALGAAQLAVAIATPIPKFAEGTERAPGGKALVGERKDKKPEMVQEPSGRTYIADRPMIVDLPAGSRVVPLLDNSKIFVERAALPAASVVANQMTQYMSIPKPKFVVNTTVINKGKDAEILKQLERIADKPTILHIHNQRGIENTTWWEKHMKR